MEAVLGLFASLGLNATIWIQLGVFLITFVIMYSLVFKPYYAAYLEREKRTHGDQVHADDLLAQARELEVVYQRKVRNLNADIKAVVDKSRAEATREHDRLVGEAREKAKATVDRAREKIRVEYGKARDSLSKEAPALAEIVASRMIGKELQ